MKKQLHFTIFLFFIFFVGCAPFVHQPVPPNNIHSYLSKTAATITDNALSGIKTKGWFHWYSRGYNPGEVELWNAIRGLDLLAIVELTPQTPGNWQVVWQVGQETLHRIVAVIAPGYLVCRMLVTTHKGPWIPGHEPEVYDVIREYGLTADYWSFDEWTSPFSRTPENLLHYYGFFSRKCHFWGDHVMPMANANWFIPDCPDNNLFKFDDDIQREGIRQASQLWDALGVGPMEILASYI